MNLDQGGGEGTSRALGAQAQRERAEAQPRVQSDMHGQPRGDKPLLFLREGRKQVQTRSEAKGIAGAGQPHNS